MRAERPTERACQDTIVQAAILHGWRVHAELPAQRQSGKWATAVQGHKGWPDLVLVRDGWLLIVELKRAPNKVEPEQQRWIDDLRQCNIDVRTLWVPEGMDEFIKTVLPRRKP